MDYAANLALFLLERTGSIFATWTGRLSANEQRELFGRAIGKGTINAVELTEYFLDQIDSHDLAPRIFARTSATRARGEAMAAAGALVTAAAATADDAALRAVNTVVMDHAQAQLLRERAWVALQGWEGTASGLPAVETLLVR